MFYIYSFASCTSCLWRFPPVFNFSINNEVQNLNGMPIVIFCALKSSSFIFRSVYLIFSNPLNLRGFIAFLGMIKKKHNVRIFKSSICHTSKPTMNSLLFLITHDYQFLNKVQIFSPDLLLPRFYSVVF